MKNPKSAMQDFNQLVQPSDNFWQFMQQSPLKGICLPLKRSKAPLRGSALAVFENKYNVKHLLQKMPVHL